MSTVHKTYWARSLAARTCCDGQCEQGRACPLQQPAAACKPLAPGAIDGPYTRRIGPLQALLKRLFGRQA